MDRPPPYSEIDHNKNDSQPGSPVGESSSHPSHRSVPSAPVSYNTGDAKIVYNSPYMVPGVPSLISTRQSFSPPHLPPSPQLYSPSTLQYSSAPPLPQKNAPSRPEMGRASYSASGSCRQTYSSPQSPVAGPSSCYSSPTHGCPSPRKQHNSNEQWKESKRRPSSSSLSSSSSSASSSSSKSSTTKQEACEDGKEPIKFDNRKSSVDWKESNKKLDWDRPHWYGKHFSLKTTNAKLNIHGTLDAKFLNFSTTNAVINWIGDSILCKEADIRTTNAKVELMGDTLEAKQAIKMKSTNAQLIFDKTTLMAKDISAVTSNAEIRMRHAQVKRSLYCKTSNARVILYIKSIKSRPKSKSPPKINVEVITSNAPVTIHMPADYSGEFKLATSQSKAVILDDPQNGVVISQDKKASSRDGYRFKKGGGSLKVTTSHGDITILFDQ